MRLILIGCEYSGTTTLGNAMIEWAKDNLGAEIGFHTHWKYPHIAHSELTEEEQAQMLAVSPRMKELIQRNNLEYHLQPSFYRDADHNMIGFYFEEAIYASLYFGYGTPDQPPDRAPLLRVMERTVLELGPETTLVHLKVSPDVVRKRMKDDPRPGSALQEKDVEHVIERFQEQYDDAIFFNRIELDTSSASVEATLEALVEQMDPYWTEFDRLRMLTHRTQRAG